MRFTWREIHFAHRPEFVGVSLQSGAMGESRRRQKIKIRKEEKIARRRIYCQMSAR